MQKILEAAVGAKLMDVLQRAGVDAAVIGFPSILFFAVWIGLMGFMGWFRKHKFQNDNAKANWTAQIINAIGQSCLLLGILFAG